jgi:hypothetical protein
VEEEDKKRISILRKTTPKQEFPNSNNDLGNKNNMLK